MRPKCLAFGIDSKHNDFYCLKMVSVTTFIQCRFLIFLYHFSVKNCFCCLIVAFFLLWCCFQCCLSFIAVLFQLLRCFNILMLFCFNCCVSLINCCVSFTVVLLLLLRFFNCFVAFIVAFL